MELLIEPKHTVAQGHFGTGLSRLLLLLEGRKKSESATILRFETSEHNLRLFRDAFPGAEEKDNRDIVAALTGVVAYELDGVPEGQAPPTSETRPSTTAVPAFKVQPYPFQLRAFEKFKDTPAFALFGEAGTGKTKTLIDIVCHRWLSRKLTGVLIFSRKGVHKQWVEEQLPEHMWSNVEWEAEAWNGKRWSMVPHAGGKLQLWATNTDSVKSERSRALLAPFLKVHGRGLMVAVDESQDIKNASAKRSVRIREIGEKVNQRVIMTGTPIAKDLTDEWAQFKFLDERIIGHKYKTAFMAQFCITARGYGPSDVVIGHRNIEHFNSLVDPYVFRVTKAEELDLPPKVYDHITFDLSDEQKTHMRHLRESFLTQLSNGEISSVTHAAAMLVRVQQLTCGHLVGDDGTNVTLKDNPRMDALLDLIEQRSGKIIIWCRFNRDIEVLKDHFKERCVTYYGATSTQDRDVAIKRFLLNHGPSAVDFFIANPAAAGVGLNLQGECRTAIYYSNSFNALERWQSEDRIHRIGTNGTVTYFDLIARGSFDKKILANLRAKKNLSDWVLDDTRRLISEALTT